MFPETVARSKVMELERREEALHRSRYSSGDSGGRAACVATLKSAVTGTVLPSVNVIRAVMVCLIGWIAQILIIIFILKIFG